MLQAQTGVARLLFAREKGKGGMTMRYAAQFAFNRLLTTIVLAVVVAVAFVGPVGAQSQDDSESITIDLNEVEESGVSGSATLTAKGDEVIVSSQIEGEMVTGDHPTHIHTGTCEDFDPDPTFPLNTVVLDPVDNEGVSETTVDAISLDELLRGDWVILVHKSAEELTTYLVCGDIKADEDGQNADQQEGVGGMSEVPSAGAGTAVSDRGGATTLLIALGTVVALTAVAGIAMRRLRARA